MRSNLKTLQKYHRKRCAESVGSHFGGAISAASSAKAGAALNFTRLLIIFTTAHLFFDSTPFNKFTEAANGVLNCFLLSER